MDLILTSVFSFAVEEIGHSVFHVNFDFFIFPSKKGIDKYPQQMFMLPVTFM